MDIVDTIEGPQLIKRALGSLFETTLIIQADVPTALLDVFDEQDLVHATHIMTAVLFPLAFRHHHGLPPEAQEMLAVELGRSIRQTVLHATGIDLHEAVKGGNADV